MYLAGIQYRMTKLAAEKIGRKTLPEGGKSIIRLDPLGHYDQISLTPKPMYPGQEAFIIRRNDIEV